MVTCDDMFVEMDITSLVTSVIWLGHQAVSNLLKSTLMDGLERVLVLYGSAVVLVLM